MKLTYADGVFEELINLSFYLANGGEEIAQKFLNACDETFLFLACRKRQNFQKRKVVGNQNVACERF